MAYGLLQFVLEPIFYTIPQMLVDYPLSFGALGLAGFFYQKKHGLIIGYLAGVLGRFFFAFLSGVIFFASYAPTGMGHRRLFTGLQRFLSRRRSRHHACHSCFPADLGALKHVKQMATEA